MKSSKIGKIVHDELGLAKNMDLVLKIHKKVREKLSIKKIHELRKAIRRCRSLADGMIRIDPNPDWVMMKKAGRSLFRPLGKLRDIHVMQHWVKDLAPPKDPAGKKLLKQLRTQEKKEIQRVQKAIERFDSKSWKKWALELPQRTRQVTEKEKVFGIIALERYQKAYQLHWEAKKSNDLKAWHQFRIGIKRFRYTLENFLPEKYRQWNKDIERMQDLLGEVHDLDVLWNTLKKTGNVFDEKERKCWLGIINKRQMKRLKTCLKKTTGQKSLWRQCRAGLPKGKQEEAARKAKLAASESFSKPSIDHNK